MKMKQREAMEQFLIRHYIGIKEVKIAIPKALYDNLYEQKDA